MPHPSQTRRTDRATLIDLLQQQAGQHPDALAYTFCADDGTRQTITYRQLDQRARAVAAELQRRPVPGQPVLLVFPAGLAFLEAFFGCAYAGRLAVPATVPKPRRPMPRLVSIAGDTAASLVLTDQATLQLAGQARHFEAFDSLDWIASDQIPTEEHSRWQQPEVGPDDVALLQYTSGSTSEPRGVRISHRNLLHNLEMIRQGFGLSTEAANRTGVFWLPAYHDMGLIGGILEPLYVAGHSVLMSPQSFLQRPLEWLKLLTEYRASVSGAPNFAYDLCVDRTTDEQRRQLDLSPLQVAFCGAEPIRPETLERFAAAMAPAGFRPEAFYPCYGAAEATLLITGRRGPGEATARAFRREALERGRAEPAGAKAPLSPTEPVERGQEEPLTLSPTEPVERGQANGSAEPLHAGEKGQGERAVRLVGCGNSLLDQVVRVVDPASGRRCVDGEVGEIWVSGPSVAGGYWNRPELSESVFGATLAGDDSRTYLRTGDLGFFDSGELFVSGRIKDVIIIRGRNHYPQDIEQSVGAALRDTGAGSACAFAIGAADEPVGDQEAAPRNDEGERLVVVQELGRQQREVDPREIAQEIRRAVADAHDVEVAWVVLVRFASLPRTTSGKIQRALCRQQFLAEELKTRPEWTVRCGGRSVGRRDEPTARFASLASTLGSRSALLDLGPDRAAERLEQWLLDWLCQRLGLSDEERLPERPFLEYGVDSMAAVELSQQLEEALEVRLTPVIAWNHPTPRRLARYLASEVSRLADQAAGGEEAAAGDASAGEGASAGEDAEAAEDPLARLVAELEELSDEEVEAALKREQDAGGL